MTQKLRSWTVGALVGVCTVHQASAEPAPLAVSLLSAKSTDGSFAFAVSGASSCAAVAAGVRLEGGTPLTIQEVGACTFTATPASALSFGQHCIDASATGATLQAGCFMVTGTAADLSRAQLTIENVGPDSWEPARCRPCDRPSNLSACTRSARELRVRVGLTNAPEEVASAYAFYAVSHREGETMVRMPEERDAFLFSADMVKPLLLLEDATSNERSCLRLYARALPTQAITPLGDACLESTLPTSVPQPFTMVQASCEAGFRSRWCDDNRQDCNTKTGRTFDGCQDYGAVCGSDAGVRDAAVRDAAVTDAEAPDGAVEASGQQGAVSASRPQSGCDLGSGDARGVFLLLVLLFLERRRRTAHA